VLLTGAGLLVRSLWKLQAVETGFVTDEVLTLRVWLPQPNEPSAGPYFEHPKRVALIRSIVERLASSPQVRAAGLATALPATRDTGSPAFTVEGWAPNQDELTTATTMSVTAGYFPVFGVRLLEGRLLEDRDDERATPAAVINETFARTYFRNEEAIGRRFRFVNARGIAPPSAPWITIVGVIADVKEDGLDAAVRPQIYRSLLQSSTLSLAIVARGHGGPPPATVVEQAVRNADSNLPLYAVRTGEDLIAAQLAQRRFATRLINAFALMALLLAAFGLHGIIAYGVRQRTHEIGVRIALGATAARVVALVLGQAVRLSAGGIAVGLAGAFVLSQFLRTMLFEISPTDPRTIAATVAILIAVIGLATIGAARRATRIEAAAALRQE
jgi:putative ABC transport system permease protein